MKALTIQQPWAWLIIRPDITDPQERAAVRGLSMEPLLGPVTIGFGGVMPNRWQWLDGDSLHWVIVGGESGPLARQFDLSWSYNIILQCRKAGVPVFVKQLGSRPTSVPWGYTITGKGGDWNEWPADLRIREYPPS